MDSTPSSSIKLMEDNLASRQADAIEAGSILISLANSHKPSNDHQELEAAAIAMESMSKHHKTYSTGSLYSQPIHNNEHKKLPSSSSMSIHNLLSDDRPASSSSTQPESPDITPKHETPSYSLSSVERNSHAHYLASPPAVHKRPMDSGNYPVPNKRSSVGNNVDHSMPHRYAPVPEYDHPDSHSQIYHNGRAVYRNTQDYPYRTRKDHRFNADAYHYDHMTHASNSSQQRQISSHPGAQPQSRKSSISTASHTQKYYIMKQSPKVKRNAMHAYISYTIYMDITRRASLKNQMIAEDQMDRGQYYQHVQNSPTPTAIYNRGPDRRKFSQSSYNRPAALRNETSNGNGDESEYRNNRRRGSMTYTNMYPSPHPHEHYAEPAAQPQSLYRSPALESYPPQELLAQPLTAYLRERNSGQPR